MFCILLLFKIQFDMNASAKKWEDVFKAHPKVSEIYIGKNNDGIEQPFLRHGDAVNFAGSSVRVETIKKDVPPKSVPEVDEGKSEKGSVAKKEGSKK